MRLREFRRKHGDRERIWFIQTADDSIVTKYGWRGGKMRETVDIPGSSSREDELERAESRAFKLVRDKLKAGYTEYHVGTATPIGKVAPTTIDFSSAIPDGFETFKPRPMPKQGSKEWHKLHGVLVSDREIITRKYDGMKHLLQVQADGSMHLFTRRMKEATGNYPWVMKEFKKFDIPPRSLVTCELYMPTLQGTENMATMQSLARSLPNRAMELQQRIEHSPKAVVLAPIYWGGKSPVAICTVAQWLGLLNIKFDSYPRIPGRSPIIQTMQIFWDGLRGGMKYVEKHGLEGLVVYDSTAVFGDKAFNFRGKSERPACWKVKPINEDDFIAVFDPHNTKFSHGGSYGSGKNRTVVGSLALYQLNSEKKLVYICDVGSGLDDGLRKIIAEGAEGKYWVQVASIEFAKRKYKRNGDDTNALTFPTFRKTHEDKVIDEVVNKEL